ncbi:MAG: site-specific integrase [Rhodococcus sp.]|nr:site-specific integrase [Rhodococcus sp. (in: high G+C Gram-positive bacteria)]
MARGSVFKRSGGWAYKVDTGFHPETGKRRQKVKQGFRTKREAELALAEVQKTVIDGTVVSGTNLRLGDFLDEWLAGQESRLRATTHYSYNVAVGRLKKHLGRYKLQALTPMQIEKFYAELLDHGGRNGESLSPKTVRNTHVVLRKALADAERLGLVPRNAAAAARGPSVSRPEMTTWTSDQLRTFAQVAERSRMRHAFTVLATTGMRRGEALGLRWGDIDFDAGQLAIVQTVTAIEGKILIGKPKTSGSRRTVYVHDVTVKALRQQRQLQAEERLAAGPAWSQDNDLVFRTPTGDPVNPDWFSRHFDQLVAEADVPRIRLHDLRHTNATLSLKAGVHPKIVSERLGHSSIAITLDMYSHVTPGISRDAAATVESMMFE